MGDDTLMVDRFVDALLGFARRPGKPWVAAYDYDQCVAILMKEDSLTRDDAHDFMMFNVVDAWMGEGTPMFILGIGETGEQNLDFLG